VGEIKIFLNIWSGVVTLVIFLLPRVKLCGEQGLDGLVAHAGEGNPVAVPLAKPPQISLRSSAPQQRWMLGLPPAVGTTLPRV
jgi:hypothetical protein